MARLDRRGRLTGRLAVAVWAIMLLIGATSAHAQSFEEMVQALGKGSFNAKVDAVERIAATGDPRVAKILDALLERDLYTVKETGAVVIAKRSDGAYALTDPLTMKPAGTAKKSAIKRIRTNNRLRGTIRSAIGGLTLLSPDAATRTAAADEVFKTPKAKLIPVLEKALSRETDEGARSALERALAMARLTTGAKGEERVAAVNVLGRYAEPEILVTLSNLLRKSEDGTYAEPDESVREAAQAAVSDIESRLAFWDFIGKLFQGLSLGSVLLLAAIGLAITFGVMGVINMAHGEMVMLGAYTTFVIQELFRSYAPAGFDYSLFVAIPAAFAVAGLFGVAIERGIIRYLYGRPLETLLATWGLSLILQQLVRTIFGPTNREVGNPSWMTGAIELQGGVLLTYNRIWIIVFSLLVIAMLAVIIKKTAFGLQMRAVTQNRSMASAMGIRTGWIDAMTFGLGSGIAGMGGVALSQIDNVSPNLGQAYIVDSFMVVVFGGVGNLLGTLVGATTLGIVNKFLEAWSGAVLAKILVLIAVILFIQKRPRGLFALKGRAAEA